MSTPEPLIIGPIDKDYKDIYKYTFSKNATKYNITKECNRIGEITSKVFDISLERPRYKINSTDDEVNLYFYNSNCKMPLGTRSVGKIFGVESCKTVTTVDDLTLDQAILIYKYFGWPSTEFTKYKKISRKKANKQNRRNKENRERENGKKEGKRYDIASSTTPNWYNNHHAQTLYNRQRAATNEMLRHFQPTPVSAKMVPRKNHGISPDGANARQYYINDSRARELTAAEKERLRDYRKELPNNTMYKSPPAPPAPPQTLGTSNTSKYTVGQLFKNGRTITRINPLNKTITVVGGLNSHKKKPKSLKKTPKKSLKKKPKKLSKKKSTKKSISKSTPKKHKGPRGGVYIIRKGRKIYQ